MIIVVKQVVNGGNHQCSIRFGHTITVINWPNNSWIHWMINYNNHCTVTIRLLPTTDPTGSNTPSRITQILQAGGAFTNHKMTPAEVNQRHGVSYEIIRYNHVIGFLKSGTPPKIYTP